MNSHPRTTADLFPSTIWSRIVAAGGPDAGAEQALEDICRRYWHPVRRFLVSLGSSPADAEDLTQQFFSRWTRGDNLKRLDPARGRLRSYLKQALRRDFVNAWHRRRHRPLTTPLAPGVEHAVAEEASHAEALYDVAWAETVAAVASGSVRSVKSGGTFLIGSAFNYVM